MNKKFLFLVNIFSENYTMPYNHVYHPVDNFNRKFSKINDTQTNIYKFFIIIGFLTSLAIITISIIDFTKNNIICILYLILALLNIFAVFITAGFKCTISAIIKIFVILYAFSLCGLSIFKYVLEESKDFLFLTNGILNIAIGGIQLAMMIFYEKLILMN